VDPEGNQAEDVAAPSPRAPHFLSAAFYHGLVQSAGMPTEQYEIRGTSGPFNVERTQRSFSTITAGMFFGVAVPSKYMDTSLLRVQFREIIHISRLAGQSSHDVSHPCRGVRHILRELLSVIRR